MRLEFVRDRLILPPIGGAEDDPGAKDEPLRGGAAPGPGFELGTLLGREFDRRGDPHAPPWAKGHLYYRLIL